MLGVILKIVSIIGIILLVLFCIVFVTLLLVLFMPIVYKADAEKSETELRANACARWLFGFLRVGYHYPESGRVIVKLLWFTVFDSGSIASKNEKEAGKTEENGSNERRNSEDDNVSCGEETDAGEVTSDQKQNMGQNENREEVQNENPQANPSEEKKLGLSEKLFQKYEKIKYTIQQLCDKMKHIWENISFYKKLLENEQTKLLFSHVCKRLSKILQHIRPRKIKANLIFGADSPDTTGYVYGVYGMFSPQLGKDVCITPDFTQKILQGNISVAGHITVFTLLVNVLAVVLDKRLRIFIKRVKMHSAKMAKE